MDKKRLFLAFGGCFLKALSVIWLLVQTYTKMHDPSFALSFWCFILSAFLAGALWFCIDGNCFSGFLKNKITITSKGSDIKIHIFYGDIFQQEGWIAVGVNDFFDSQVDDIVVAKNSLHGMMIKTYWGGNTKDFDEQIYKCLAHLTPEIIDKIQGKVNRYPIGTTVPVRHEDKKILCIALTKMNPENYKTETLISEFYSVLCQFLDKARSTCANIPLYIPLLGNGLSRLGLSHQLLLIHIITAIFEETKKGKITENINIVLHNSVKKHINLSNIKEIWG